MPCERRDCKVSYPHTHMAGGFALPDMTPGSGGVPSDTPGARIVREFGLAWRDNAPMIIAHINLAVTNAQEGMRERFLRIIEQHERYPSLYGGHQNALRALCRELATAIRRLPLATD